MKTMIQNLKYYLTRSRSFVHDGSVTAVAFWHTKPFVGKMTLPQKGGTSQHGVLEDCYGYFIVIQLGGLTANGKAHNIMTGRGAGLPTASRRLRFDLTINLTTS